ncbi:MAG: 3-deoxy-8-phosphooctulonate synthase [Desulfosudaceae bacterium]
MTDIIEAENIRVGGDSPLLIMAGPCVIEDYATVLQTARTLKAITDELNLPFIFKASYDKANRSSITSFRGPGLEKGLEILKEIKQQLNIPIISDVHLPEQIAPAAEVLDILQVPAFLCRQTDFIIKIAETGKIINIKKGQFLAPWDVGNIIDKAASVGNHRILITERGSVFGYNNLVVDFRGIPIMQEQTGKPVIFDATHSVQLPGGSGTSSGGQRQFAPVLARAAVAAGADGIFLEVHPDPDQARCDGPNSLHLDDITSVLRKLQAIRKAIQPDPEVSS